jgi:hypothetical protein
LGIGAVGLSEFERLQQGGKCAHSAR